ncbi:MAG: hypothetical protein FWC21_04995 [Treponema sp.]|nr:hypothetical protein [Treponema sp.]
MINYFFREYAVKRILSAAALALFAINGLFAQTTFSGVFDSTVSMAIGAGNSPDFSFGLEEYANIRFYSRLREGAVINGAVNLFAATGSYARRINELAAAGISSPLPLTAYTAGDYYIAAIELERLHFRLRTEHVDIDGGLMRIPFGYGQVFRSSDFLNPVNPLKPDARSRAALGAGVIWFPVDDLKLYGFFTAPRNVFTNGGEGTIFGLSMDHHLRAFSSQVLYSYETPSSGSNKGIHRAGLSLKADVKAGLHLDALYTYNHEAKTNYNGLSLSAGFDYSFFGGDLIILAEYLYNGDKSSTALYEGGSFINNHYLYTGFTYIFNDFTNMNFTFMTCFDDVSFASIISVNHEIFQGVTFTVSAQVPLDRDLFSGNGKRGEFGPIRPDSDAGSYFNCSARIRIRF